MISSGRLINFSSEDTLFLKSFKSLLFTLANFFTKNIIPIIASVPKTIINKMH